MYNVDGVEMTKEEAEAAMNAKEETPPRRVDPVYKRAAEVAMDRLKRQLDEDAKRQIEVKCRAFRKNDETGEWEQTVNESMKIDVLDKPAEYINVWDACGQLGYLIPWSRWKAQSPTIYPGGAHRQFVDVKCVALYSLQSVTGKSFDLPARGMPVVLVEDFRGGPDGIDWERVRLAIVDAARRNDCMTRAVPVPSIEFLDEELSRAYVLLNDVKTEKRRLSDRLDELVAENRALQDKLAIGHSQMEGAKAAYELLREDRDSLLKSLPRKKPLAKRRKR